MYAPHVEYVLRIADSALIFGHRLSELCGHGPVLEEDLAFANIALDMIGQARLLMTHAGHLEGRGRDEDRLAYRRTDAEYRNITLAELPNGHFGATVLRTFLFGAYQTRLWTALSASADTKLGTIARQSVKESRYHTEHCADWVVRLGDGTAESHARMQAALDETWPYTAELFTTDAVEETLAALGIAPPSSTLEAEWSAAVLPVLEQATLEMPPRGGFRSHGKYGAHSEHLGPLLAEMQYLQRAYPDATC